MVLILILSQSRDRDESRHCCVARRAVSTESVWRAGGLRLVARRPAAAAAAAAVVVVGGGVEVRRHCRQSA